MTMIGRNLSSKRYAIEAHSMCAAICPPEYKKSRRKRMKMFQRRYVSHCPKHSVGAEDSPSRSHWARHYSTRLRGCNTETDRLAGRSEIREHELRRRFRDAQPGRQRCAMATPSAGWPRGSPLSLLGRLPRCSSSTWFGAIADARVGCRGGIPRIGSGVERVRARGVRKGAHRARRRGGGARLAESAREPATRAGRAGPHLPAGNARSIQDRSPLPAPAAASAAIPARCAPPARPARCPSTRAVPAPKPAGRRETPRSSRPWSRSAR